MHQPLEEEGFSLERVLKSLPEEKHDAAEALRSLVAGNRRFTQGSEFAGCVNNLERRAELRDGQSPRAIVICCADSRSPPELIFDRGYGDLFVIRVAGNVVSQHVLGSISYALMNLGTRVIVVLGHTKCGAIKASVADFVETTATRLQERQQEEEARAAAHAAEGVNSVKARESRSFFSRLLAVFGGTEEAATLVRTASFRDADHAAHPINSIVLSIQPAVKDVVWALLHAPVEKIGAYAPPGGSSPGASPTGGEAAGASWSEANGDGDAGASSSDSESSESEGEGMWYGPHHHHHDYSPTHHHHHHHHLGATPQDIMRDLQQNNRRWAAPESLSGGSSSGGEEGDEDEEWGAAAAGEPGGKPLAPGLASWQEPEEEEDVHIAPLRWDCDALQGAIASGAEVCEDTLHSRLVESSESICLHTAMRCSKVVNSVTYQNVRRQAGEIWESMRAWVDQGIMRHVLMATAIYDLDTGHVDFFGLQSFDHMRRSKSRASLKAG